MGVETKNENGVKNKINKDEKNKKFLILSSEIFKLLSLYKNSKENTLSRIALTGAPIEK